MAALLTDVKIKLATLNIPDLSLIYCSTILHDEKGKVTNYHVLL